MPRVSNEYGVLEVKCKRKCFSDLFLITSLHSNTQQLALYVLALGKNLELAGRTGDFVN